MIPVKFLLAFISTTLGIASVIIAFKAYALALRNEIRVKYYRFLGQYGVEELKEKEYAQRLSSIITITVVMLLLAVVIIYLLVLCAKHNVPLFG